MAKKSVSKLLYGNVLIFQGISTRDKHSGKYLPLMDGNLNVTLSRLYNAQDHINKAIITLPEEHNIDSGQLQMLHDVINNIFGKSSMAITFVHMKDIYKSNIDETRKHILSSVFSTSLYNNLIDIDENFDVVLSEFAVTIPTIKGITDGATIAYSYNWSYCSHDETSQTLKDSFENEQKLALNHQTFLYSEIQYNFWKDVVSIKAFKNTTLENKIFSSEYISLIAAHNLDILDGSDKYRELLFDIYELQSVIKSDTIVFYPSRIEDPRYDFKRVIENTKTLGATLIITNPTNFDTTTIDELYDGGIKCIVDLSLLDPQVKRLAYFYILSTLKSTDVIYRYEHDMHISLIEQMLITMANIETPYISRKSINNYIS